MRASLFLLFLLPYLAIGGTFELSIENDLVADSDKHYTHGTRLSYSYLLDNNSFSDKTVARTWSLGQYIYTPSDISFETIQFMDRPYNGWLYGASSIMVYDKKELDSLEINLGLTGKWSLADKTQIFIHKLIHSKEPRGWDTQLKERVGVNLTYIKKYKWKWDYADCIVKGNITAGTIHINTGVGGLIRFGYNIPDDFGITRMEPLSRSLSKLGFYGIIETSGRYIAFNQILEGYRSDHVKEIYGIHAEDMVGDLDMGCGLSYGCFNLIYLYNIRSKEFKQQKEHNEFGTVVISWNI